MPNNESLSSQTVRKVMTMSLAKLSDFKFVYDELIGDPGGQLDHYSRRALEVRKLLEDMKATRASHRICRLALILAVGSFIVAVGSVIASTVLR